MCYFKMNNHKNQYAKNTFTTSSDDDKINKENTGSSYPDFGKPVFRGNSKGVENRFHSATNIPAQSENKPYSYGIPMSREDKIAQSLGRSLAKEKNRVKAIADKMSRDIEKTKQEQKGTQSAKRSDTSFALQDKNDAPLKAEKLSVVTPVPKEQKIYSGTPVNPEYAISKTYGTEKEKDVFAVLKGMDEVTGKDDAGRYLRGRTEWLTHNHFDHLNQEDIQRKTSSMLDSGSLNAYGNYKKSNEKKNALNPDSRVSMEDDFQVDDVPMANPGKILQKIDDGYEAEIQHNNGLSDIDYVTETIAKKSTEKGFMYKAQTQKERAYVRISGAHDDDIFDYNVYNDIVRQADVNYNHIHTNYKEIKNNRLAYAITKLIEMKIYYDDAETEKNNAKTAEKRNTYNEVQKIYSEAGRYLKAYIDFVVYGGSENTREFTSNAITEALNHENVYDGKSIDYWLKALNYALDPRNAAAVRGSSEVNMSIYDLRADLTALKDSLQIRGKAEIRGYVSGSDSRLYVRYSSDTGVLNPTVTTNKYPLYLDPTPGDPFYEMRENGIIIQ